MINFSLPDFFLKKNLLDYFRRSTLRPSHLCIISFSKYFNLYLCFHLPHNTSYSVHFITLESEVAFDFAHHPITVVLMIAQISPLNLNHAMKFITIILLEAYDTPYNWAEALLNCCFLSRINVSMKILLSPLKHIKIWSFLQVPPSCTIIVTWNVITQ